MVSSIESEESSGNFQESSKKVSKEEEKVPESSKKVPDWRQMKSKLSRKEMEGLANLSPDQMRQYSMDTGFTYKTISNWRLAARKELGMENKDE